MRKKSPDSAKVAAGEPVGAAGVVSAKKKRWQYKVRREKFAGKTCSLSAAFKWAYASQCIGHIVPADAPSAEAWQMYVDMLENPQLRCDLIKSRMGKEFGRDGDDEAERGIDGQGEYDVCAAIVRAACGEAGGGEP